MPAVEIERTTSASPAAIWAFVSDMNNWAPLLTGYQSHEVLDDRHSVWVVRGEMGGLSRLAEFDVEITAWDDPDHIAFTLVGRDEPFTGSGAFRILGAEVDRGVAAPLSRPGLWSRIRMAIARWLLGRVTTLADDPVPEPATASSAILHCRLEVQAGGGSGPIMNVLLGPILEAVAQDTGNRIVAALDGLG